MRFDGIFGVPIALYLAIWVAAMAAFVEWSTHGRHLLATIALVLFLVLWLGALALLIGVLLRI